MSLDPGNETPHHAVRPWIGARGWLRRLRGRVRRMRVADLTPVASRMLRVTLVSDDLGDFVWTPGQDMVLELPLPGGEIAPRHYTIAGHDPARGRLDFDVVLHGEGAAARWLDALAVGDALLAVGPRGHTRLNRDPDVDSHLFLGDETAMPAILAMARALPADARARAVIEVEDEADVRAPETGPGVTVEWRCRRGAPAASSRLLQERLDALAPAPRGVHAYVLGETGKVRTLRHRLLLDGFDKTRITAEGYWRPGRVGGHDHL